MLILFLGLEVLKRWKNLRDSFAKAEKKMKESKASGSKGTQKKKYIFNEELQFLKKIYCEREATESYNIENKEEDEISVVNTSHDADKTVTSNTTQRSEPSQRTRKHQKMDEVDIKILKTLDTPQQQPNSKMPFFHSLLPHVEKFTDNQMLEFQMGVLLLISHINSKQTPVPHNQEISTAPLYQPAPNYSQSFNLPNIRQQQFISQTMPPFNPQHSVPYQATSFTTQIQRPFTTQSMLIPHTQAINVVPVSTTTHVQQQTAESPAESPIGAQELRNDGNSALQYYETFLQQEESSDRPSSECSAASSMNLDFTILK